MRQVYIDGSQIQEQYVDIPYRQRWVFLPRQRSTTRVCRDILQHNNIRIPYRLSVHRICYPYNIHAIVKSTCSLEDSTTNYIAG